MTSTHLLNSALGENGGRGGQEGEGCMGVGGWKITAYIKSQCTLIIQVKTSRIWQEGSPERLVTWFSCIKDGKHKSLYF